MHSQVVNPDQSNQSVVLQAGRKLCPYRTLVGMSCSRRSGGGIFPTGSPIYQENRVLGSTKFYDTSKSTVLSQLKRAYQCLENNNDSCTGMKQPLTLNNEFILHSFDLTTSIWQSRHSNKLNTHPLKPWCSFPQNSNTVLD